MRTPWRVRCLVAIVGTLLLGAGPAFAATGTLWQSDFTNAGFGNYKSTPWNDVGAAAPTLVTSTVYAPSQAARFTVPAGGTRSEIEPNVANFVEGDEYWFGDTFTLPSSFPTAESSWQVLTQWKNADTGSPPLEIKIGSGHVILDGGYGYPGGPAGSKYWTTTLGPAATVTPTNLVLHVKFSSNPSIGYVDAWLNGTQVLTGYHPVAGTLYPSSKKTKATATQAKAQKAALARTPQPQGTPKEPAASTDTVVTASTTSSQFSYWKMGMYRDSAITSNAVYDLENARMGTSYSAVQ
ncbi:heparin lyase I family protein [Actinomycetospora chiangmaiensis]|uniref:heparin lyase I family protein n=1 Tax=Actinomycetospora chiangmaiensis TaxID=402650 RepID=UPI000374BFBB|nr:heparin lyase I family protein [Actinomycetospora chiangmaiensis]